jgi:hypothetical protein
MVVCGKYPVVYICIMIPDYPHKLFQDLRQQYCLLMESLAMQAGA